MLVNQLFDLDSIERLSDSPAEYLRTVGEETLNRPFLPDIALGQSFGDAASTGALTYGVVLQRMYQYVNPMVLVKKYPQLTFLNLPISTNNSGGYAHEVISLRLLPQGEFRKARDRSSNSGRISIKGEHKTIEVHPMESFIEYSDDEVREAELQNINLISRLLEANVHQYKREIDQIGLIGIEDNEGLLTSKDFPMTTSAKMDGLGTVAMYDAVSRMIETQWNSVKNTPEYMATHVIFPIDVHNLLAHRVLNSAGSEMSVLKALQVNYPNITFTSSFRCDADQFTDGMSRTIAFNPSPECMEFRLPIPLQIGEIVRENSFQFKMQSKYRAAGLDIYESTAGYYVVGF